MSCDCTCPVSESSARRLFSLPSTILSIIAGFFGGAAKVCSLHTHRHHTYTHHHHTYTHSDTPMAVQCITYSLEDGPLCLHHIGRHILHSQIRGLSCHLHPTLHHHHHHICWQRRNGVLSEDNRRTTCIARRFPAGASTVADTASPEPRRHTTAASRPIYHRSHIACY
jgi:hypothetical protein